MDEAVRLEQTVDEALVLFNFLQRFEDDGTLAILDQAEERVLWNLHCLLEKQLVELFHPEYKALLAAARDRVRDPPGVRAGIPHAAVSCWVARRGIPKLRRAS